MPDNESTAKENAPDKAPPEEDDAWVPLPSTRRLRGGRRRPTPAPAEPRPRKPEDGG